MKQKADVCCCTGHRPKGFVWGYNTDCEKNAIYHSLLYEKVKSAAENGFRLFLSGMALGVDMDFAESVIKLRDKNRLPIYLQAVIPCKNQTEKWDKQDVVRYNKILSRADSSVILSEEYTPDCMLARNRYMVDKSSLIIAVFNGIQRGGTWYTIRYARKQGLEIDLLHLIEDI